MDFLKLDSQRQVFDVEKIKLYLQNIILEVKLLRSRIAIYVLLVLDLHQNISINFCYHKNYSNEKKL